MRAIIVRYLPATNIKPARWKAFVKPTAGKTVTILCDNPCGFRDHEPWDVAELLILKLRWTGHTWHEAQIGNDYGFVASGITTYVPRVC
jgi:hypothetical protein